MAKSRLDNSGDREGHGDENFFPQPTKGTFIDGGGTAVELGGMKPKATSSNSKTGAPGGVSPLS